MIYNAAGGPSVATDPKTIEQSEQQTVDYVLERLSVSERFDRPFKERALAHWQQINNILPEPWPYYSRYFEPETQNACNDTIEAIMSQVFQKDTYFDLEPVEEQDEAQTEMMRELMRFVLREKCRYKMMKYYQCQEAVFFGNGVEKHLIRPKLVTRRSRQPVMAGDVFRAVAGMQLQETRDFEVWPASEIVSTFDCYPAPTGATIQEMPYFIERMIVPIDKIKAMAKWAGFKHVDEIEGFFSLDQTEGQATGNWSEKHFDLFERLNAVGYNVRGDGVVGSAGNHAVKYAELLVYNEAPPDGDGGGKICLLADRKFLIKEWPTNPFDHGLKNYSDIKFQPRSEQVWRAKGVAELEETLQLKLNTRISQAGDIIEDIRAPMTFVGQAAGIEDLSDLDPWPGAIVRAIDEKAIRERVRPGVPREIFEDIEFTRASIQRSGGALDYGKGVAGTSSGLARGTETATGIQLLLNASNQAKSFRWLLAEETGITDGLNIIASLIQQVMTTPQKIRILGENEILRKAGWKESLTVNPEDIAGRWNFYAVGASRAMDNAAQAELSGKIIEGWSKFDKVWPRVKQLDVAVELAEMGGMRNPRRFIMNDEEFAQQPQPQIHPATKLIETMDYKDLPPDVQRQLEALLGLQPSQVGGSSQIEQVAAKARLTPPKPAPAKAR